MYLYLQYMYIHTVYKHTHVYICEYINIYVFKQITSALSYLLSPTIELSPHSLINKHQSGVLQ